MSLSDTLVNVALVGGVALVGAWAIKNYLVNPAGDLGAWVGQNVLTPVIYNSQYPATAWKGIQEGWGVPSIPATPPGYLPSNWSWDVSSAVGIPTILGLPAGMTPGEFCAGYPSAPICSSLYPAGSGGGGR